MKSTQQTPVQQQEPDAPYKVGQRILIEVEIVTVRYRKVEDEWEIQFVPFCYGSDLTTAKQLQRLDRTGEHRTPLAQKLQQVEADLERIQSQIQELKTHIA